MNDNNSSNSNSNSNSNRNNNEENKTRVAKQQQPRRQNNDNNKSSKNESTSLTSLLLRRPIISMLVSIVAVYGLGYLYKNNTPTTHYLLSSLSSSRSSRGRGSSRATSRSIAKARKKRLLYGTNDAVFGYIEEKHAGSGSTKIPFGSVLDAGTGPQSLRWIATLAAGDDDHNQNYKKGNKGKGMTDFTAVTADETMRKNVQREMDQLGISSQLGTVVIGNWFPSSSSSSSSDSDDNDDDDDEGSVDESLRQLQRQQQNSGPATTTTTTTTKKQYYDTIIADYLIGAMEGFSPYKQDLMIDKLASYLKPPTGITSANTTTTDEHEQQQQQQQQRGGRLYIIGLEPMPDSYDDGIHGKESPQNLICELRRIRHACILLAGIERPYREYPYEWVKRRIMHSTPTNQSKNSLSSSSSNTNQLQLIDSQIFPIFYHHSTILRQINDARSKLPHFSSKLLAKEMSKVLDQLEKRNSDYFTDTEQANTNNNSSSSLLPSKKTIELGFDYVVVAERIGTDNWNDHDIEKEKTETEINSSTNTNDDDNNNNNNNNSNHDQRDL